jgi:predicted AAA+ superfamily ATPase
VLALAERVLAREVPPEPNGAVDVPAFRFRRGGLEPIAAVAAFPPDALIGVERSVARLRANLSAFAAGRPALDSLLYGERGTGKSSAVRGVALELAPQGLRLVEVRRDDRFELPRIFGLLRARAERFAIFCDDLSFAERDDSWKELKAALDGGVEARPDNALILATSNRRHLLTERASENRDARITPDGELHPGETAEEKLSLSDRFGLLLPFFAFDQPTYLRIVDGHARDVGLEKRLPREEIHARALRVALERASRSGRTARQACIAILQELEARG